MKHEYEVTLADQSVGKAVIEKKGLYYHLICRCRLSGEVMCRLILSCGEKTLDLGILIPMEHGFGLDTQFPASRLGEGEIILTVKPKNQDTRKFIPIKPEEPFHYLNRLQDAFLEKHGDVIGISIPE